MLEITIAEAKQRIKMMKDLSAKKEKELALRLSDFRIGDNVEVLIGRSRAFQPAIVVDILWVALDDELPTYKMTAIEVITGTGRLYTVIKVEGDPDEEGNYNPIRKYEDCLPTAKYGKAP